MNTPRVASIARVIVFAFGIAFWATAAEAQTAAVNVSTSSPQTMKRKLTGYNNGDYRTAYDLSVTDYLNRVDSLNLGWWRWYSGTVVNTFNWERGTFDDEKRAQVMSKGHFLQYVDFSHRENIKGNAYLKDIYDVVSSLGMKFLVTVNGMTATVDEVDALAKYCFDHGIIVDAWELSNEPELWSGEGDGTFYRDAEDYLNKMKPFNDAIKTRLSGAKTYVYYSTRPLDTGGQAWNQEIKAYQTAHGRYWDGVTFHSYDGENSDDTFTKKQLSANLSLKDFDTKIQEYLDQSWPSAPLIITELNTRIQTSSGFWFTMYDDNIGRVLTAVAAKGSTIAENTLIIFVSDNGNVDAGSSGGLSGGKQTLFEGGIHTPLAMKWSSEYSVGDYTNPVSTLDLLPTIARAAGVTTQALTNISSEGINLTPFVLGTQTGLPHPDLFWRYVGDDVVASTDVQDMLAVRSGSYKYIREVDKSGTTTEHLYDLAASLVETPQNNLAANPSYETMKANLITSLNTWNKGNPLDEDFSSSIAYGFIPYHSSTSVPANWTVSGGNYTITNGNSGDRAIVQTTHFEDAIYSVTAKISTTNGKAGLILRSSNQAQGGPSLFTGYFAQIATGNTVSFVKVDNGSQVTLKTITAQGTTISSGVNYELKVVAVGPDFEVYIDNIFQFQWTDSTYAGGAVGLRLGTTSTSTVVFDDLVVTPL